MEPSGSGAAAASTITKRSSAIGGGAAAAASTAANGTPGGGGRGNNNNDGGSIGAASTSSVASASKKPRKAPPKPSLFQRFAQQELSGWSPIITPRGLVAYFLVAGLICAAAGGALLAATLSVVEASARYDDVGPFAAVASGSSSSSSSATNAAREALLAAAGGEGVNVTVDIPITRDMRPPIYVYYELTNFFQNHKRYVRSRDDNQMGGGGAPPPDGTIDDVGGGLGVKGPAERCEPRRYADSGVNGSSLLPAEERPVISPCGLVAWSNFNDSFSASLLLPPPPPTSSATKQQQRPPPVPLAIDDSSIAWPTDATQLYGAIVPTNFNDDPATRGGGAGAVISVNGSAPKPVPLDEDQHLMVWLRPAAAPTFRKLWGVIDSVGDAGDVIPAGSVVRFAVDNRYNTYGFGGKKLVVLSTDSWAGGKNLFLPCAFLSVAGACLLAAVAFAAASGGACAPCGVRRRKFGDPTELSWNRNGSRKRF